MKKLVLCKVFVDSDIFNLSSCTMVLLNFLLFMMVELDKTSILLINILQ